MLHIANFPLFSKLQFSLSLSLGPGKSIHVITDRKKPLKKCGNSIDSVNGVMHHPNATPPYAQLPLPLRPNELSIIAITLWHRDKQATQRKGDRDRERE